MVLKLPDHSHCLHCGDPTPFGTDYCSKECRERHRKDKLKNNIRDFAFYATVGLALCILAYRFIF